MVSTCFLYLSGNDPLFFVEFETLWKTGCRESYRPHAGSRDSIDKIGLGTGAIDFRAVDPGCIRCLRGQDISSIIGSRNLLGRIGTALHRQRLGGKL